PLQGGRHVAQPLEFHQRRWDERWGVWAQRGFPGRHLREVRNVLERVAAEVRKERQDADAHPALRYGLSRADRAGRAVVTGDAAVRRAERGGVYPEREPQAHADGRSEAPRREPELASVLVRSVSQWPCQCDRARRAGSKGQSVNEVVRTFRSAVSGRGVY